MSSQDSSSPPPRVPPHIRLNSGKGELRSQGTSHARSLVPPVPPHLYSSHQTPNSTERLLPPPKNRASRRQEDRPSPLSPDQSPWSSRRSSWDSDQARDYNTPFRDSRPGSRAGSEDDNLNTQTVSEKYNIMPSAGLLLFPEDVENDDYLHNPDPNDNEPNECNVFTRRGMVNVGGLAFVTLGILMLFVGYPVVSVAPRTLPTQALLTLLLDRLSKDTPSSLILAGTTLFASTRGRYRCSKTSAPL